MAVEKNAKVAGVDPTERPYVIGLTGGIASGKSAICKRLEAMGAASIDCDKLGHKAYVKGTRGFDKVVEAFGADIVGEDGEVNRKALGAKVFGNKDEMEKLNNIVWPEIAAMAKQEIQQLSKDKDLNPYLDRPFKEDLQFRKTVTGCK